MAGKNKKPETEIIVKVLNHVPFQLCPKCNGSGSIIEYHPDSSFYIDCKICDLCNGAMIIPMAVIPNK